MIHIQTTTKNIDTIVQDLTAAVEEHKYGLLHAYDLQDTMRNKGVDFPHACRVLEVCNPHYAAKVLGENIRVNLALPCRIGVWEEDGQTKVGTLLPTQLMEIFGNSPVMRETSAQVEADLVAIIAAAI